jgi:galactonate dehydratase
MQVTRIDTLRLDEFPNILWVLVATEEGLMGLGETFFGAEAVEAYVHESVAPYLLGRDPLLIERHALALRGYLGFRGSGAETRGNSAIDLALWDLLGKATDRPVHALLGGACRDRIRTYNTCAGYRYIRSRPQAVENWGLPEEAGPEGPYEDLDAFLHRPDELALSLRAEGITGMKIWPFDLAAERTGGQDISAAELRQAVEPFERIRAAVGSDMDIMVELHSLWNLPTAKRIARALEPYEPYWLEDPLRADHLGGLADFAAATPIPVTASETLAGRWAFRELMERRAASVVMLDVSWVGGLTEAKAIASMAEAFHLPVAPHDCTGPVVLAASTHLSVQAPNALLQETVRAYYTGWYRELVTAVPEVLDGHVAPPPGPGLGTELLPGLEERADARRRTSTLRREMGVR